MILFYLLFGHFLADYPLQSEFLATGKNHKTPIPGFPWYQLLTAHAFIHGGIVAYITGHVWLGVIETVLHWIIDYGKSDGRYGFNTDQALHITCKVAYAIFLIYFAH